MCDEIKGMLLYFGYIYKKEVLFNIFYKLID